MFPLEKIISLFVFYFVQACIKTQARGGGGGSRSQNGDGTWGALICIVVCQSDRAAARTNFEM